MNWRINSALLLLLFSSCDQEKNKGLDENMLAKVDYLIEVEELKTIADQPHIKIIDFRNKGSYEKEHIEGALHIWRTDIENAAFPYAGIMASSSQIETLFSALGIGTDDTLIIYDDNGLCDASRLWWLLQNYDFTNVKLLHGGINLWKESNGSVSAEVTTVERTKFTLTGTPSMKYYASKEDVQNALTKDVTILDTRSLDEFSGKIQKKGATKGGRIPKSIHIDWAEAVNKDENKKFKSIEELESIYNQLNIKKDEPIIVYCHSGVRSAHTFFVLTQILKYNNVKNYDGSWTEWSYFDDLQFEKDNLTTLNN